jgi:hypothetical protein
VEQGGAGWSRVEQGGAGWSRVEQGGAGWCVASEQGHVNRHTMTCTTKESISHKSRTVTHADVHSRTHVDNIGHTPRRAGSTCKLSPYRNTCSTKGLFRYVFSIFSAAMYSP